MNKLTATAAMTAAPEAAPLIQAKMAADEAKRQKEQQEKLQKKQMEIEDAKLKALRDGGRSIGGSGSGNSGSSSFSSSQRFIFFFALAIHFLDGFVFGFARTGSDLAVILMLYLILAVYLVFWYKDSETIKRLVPFMIAAIIIPAILSFSFILNMIQGSAFFESIAGLMLAVPLVPIAAGMMFSEDSAIKKILTVYVIGWVIVGLFMVINTYSFTGPSKALISDPWSSVKFVFKSAYGVMSDSANTFKKSIAKSIASATGQPYEGSEESKVGIYVNDVKSLESKYNNQSTVYVQAKIKAANVKEPVDVYTFCYIEGVKQGDTTPEKLEGVQGNYENIVDCKLGQLKSGSYEVKVRATFEFESSSDIEYTFVSENVKSTQYQDLNIASTTFATYTGGPVALGLPALSQPLIVRNVDDAGRPIITVLSDYPFGVSLENKWPQGKIIRGLNYVLDVPKDVELVDCSRAPQIINDEEAIENRNLYRFEIDTAKTQDMFDAVRCRIKFTNTENFMSEGMKTSKTFAAKARYEYAVEGSTYITIEKS